MRRILCCPADASALESVRDFLLEPDAAGALGFSLAEARTFIRNHLCNYLRIITNDHERVANENPWQSLDIVEWLDEQKLLRLALNAAMNVCSLSNPFNVTNRISALAPPPSESLEHYSALTLKDERYVTAATDNPLCTTDCLTDNLIAAHRSPYHPCPHDRNLMRISARLFFVACSQGLVTAVHNMRDLGWSRGPTPSQCEGKAVLDGIMLAASRSKSPHLEINVKASANIDFEKWRRARREDGLPEFLSEQQMILILQTEDPTRTSSNVGEGLDALDQGSSLVQEVSAAREAQN